MIGLLEIYVIRIMLLILMLRIDLQRGLKEKKNVKLSNSSVFILFKIKIYLVFRLHFLVSTVF